MGGENKGQKEEENSNGGVQVSYFDHSADKFFASMDSIRDLWGLPREEGFDATEIERFSSTITFLKEWKYFVYEPKALNFAFDIGDGHTNEAFKGITLPQFSSAAVPKLQSDHSPDGTRCLDSDFVLHAGGLVWAMDWCPRNFENLDKNCTSEYLAVAAHPPGSTYHKIGDPLVGRGIIQIWYFVNLIDNVELPALRQSKRKGRPKGHYGNKECTDTKELHCQSLPENEELRDGLKEKVVLTVRRPRGRPIGSRNKKACSSGKILDGHDDPNRAGLVCLTGAEVGETEEQRHGFEEKMESTVRRPRGRPKGSRDKKPRSSGKILNDHDIPNKMDLVCLPSTEVGETPSGMPVNGDTSGTAETVPRPRGRPRKKPKLNPERPSMSENMVSVHASANLNKNLDLSLPKRRGRPPKNPKLNPEKPSTSENMVTLPLSVDLTKNLELSLPKCRGRFRKILNTSPVGCAQTCVFPGEEAHILHTSSGPGTSDKISESLPTAVNLDGNQESYSVDCQVNLAPVCLPQAIEALDESLALGSGTEHEKIFSATPTSGVPETYQNAVGSRVMVDLNVAIHENDLACPVPTDLSGMGSSLPRRRGRPRKLDVRRIKCVPAPALVKHSTELPASKNPSGSIENDALTNCEKKGTEDEATVVAIKPTTEDHYPSEMALTKDTTSEDFDFPKVTPLPKVVLCLAHMGKVAWDLKWRPANENDSEGKSCLGYLAVCLGNGSLEVWEVPLPSMVKALYTSSPSAGTDPRFLKLKPIFRCSKIKYGDRQCIPITLEWSPSAPNDSILAGCHDGTVALWKFSKHHASEDIKPLLCFSADSVPIRALAWAPEESDAESSNLIAIAGHGVLKFWDIRDPYRPLWKLDSVQTFILSMEWLKDPRCIIMSLDDGSLKMFSLEKVTNDALCTGESFGAAKQPGTHRYFCARFAIWSFQVSRATGLAAYCTADGFACYFQLTANAVEKDNCRYREPQFLCGSFTSNDGTFTVKTPVTKNPLPKLTKTSGDRPLCRYAYNLNEVKAGSLPAAGGGQTPPVIESNSGSRRRDKKSDLKNPLCQDSEAVDVETLQISENKVGLAEEIEVIPPKEVAIHKVRWNMNKGSERWLCYGGAAGIVRCQKVL